MKARTGSDPGLTPERFGVLLSEISGRALPVLAEAVPDASLEAVARLPERASPFRGFPASPRNVPLCEMHGILPDDA
jgi:hypothetical protein